ncbi:hypothetical protein BJV78DRAFT_1250472 [Lactifluus subvellereus]|nr:hypothetical protein BJV78DRAFT_1250472 [Lactifluus subvellereus]
MRSFFTPDLILPFFFVPFMFRATRSLVVQSWVGTSPIRDSPMFSPVRSQLGLHPCFFPSPRLLSDSPLYSATLRSPFPFPSTLRWHLFLYEAYFPSRGPEPSGTRNV